MVPPAYAVKARRRIQIQYAEKARRTKKQKRREIIEPLLSKAEAAYPDAGSYSLAKNIKDAVNRQLGKHAVKEDTIRTDIDDIFKSRKTRQQDVRS